MHVHGCTCTCMCMCMGEFARVHGCTCARVRVHVCMFARVHDVCMCSCVHVFVYACLQAGHIRLKLHPGLGLIGRPAHSSHTGGAVGIPARVCVYANPVYANPCMRMGAWRWARVHGRECMCEGAWVHGCMCEGACARVHVRTGAQVHRCMGAQVHRCTGAQVHVCMCACVHMHICSPKLAAASVVELRAWRVCRPEDASTPPAVGAILLTILLIRLCLRAPCAPPAPDLA